MASENQIKHKIVISGEQEYKRAMREMTSQLKESKSEVKATAAEMDAQGKSVEGLTSHMKALEAQRQKETDMLREMQRHLEAVVAATGAESDEATRLRTRINAMRAEVAQTGAQLSKLTGELDEAREAAEGLGNSAAATGIKGLGAAAESAEGDMDGILGKLSSLGQGITIGIGASIGLSVLNGVKAAISDAVVTGWNEAVQSRIEYNQIGVKTGTAGGATNDYMAGMLDRLKIRNPNREATEWIDALASAYTNLDPAVFNNAEKLNNAIDRLDTVSTGVNVPMPKLIEDMGRLKDVLGTSEEDAAPILYWLGTSQAGEEGISNLEKYATTWADIGMKAVNAAGALVLARISGVANLDAVGKAASEAAEFITDGTDEGNKNLSRMGLLASDLGSKFRMGGGEAAAAMQLLINKFLELSPEEQDELGPKIFGEEAWKRYGTRIADALLGGYKTELTQGMLDALEAARTAATNDINSQIARLNEIKNQALSQMIAPAEALALAGLTRAADAGAQALEEGRNWFTAMIGGFFTGVSEGVSEVSQDNLEKRLGEGYTMDDVTDAVLREFGHNPEDFKKAEDAGEKAADDVLSAYARGFARNPRMRELDEQTLAEIGSAPASAVDDFLDRLTGGDAALTATAEEKGKEDAGTVLEAYGSGMDSGADFASVKAQVENLNAQIASALNAGDTDLASELQEKRNALIPTMMQLAADAKQTGEDAKRGFDEEFKGVTVTVEDTVTGALDVLDSRTSEFYTRGWNAGEAFVNGYRDAQGIESPSKVMAEAAGYTMVGLFQGLDRGAGDLEARAAGISDTLARGASHAGGTAAALSYTTGGVDMEELRELLSGIQLIINGEVAGGLLERSVSKETARRAAGTIAGRSAEARSW